MYFLLLYLIYLYLLLINISINYKERLIIYISIKSWSSICCLRYYLYIIIYTFSYWRILLPLLLDFCCDIICSVYTRTRSSSWSYRYIGLIAVTSNLFWIILLIYTSIITAIRYLGIALDTLNNIFHNIFFFFNNLLSREPPRRRIAI